jgi:transposase
LSFCGTKLNMRKLREILRLKHGVPPLSHRDIGIAIGVSPSTVSDVWLRFFASGLGWPLADGLDDVTLEERLFASKRAGVISNKTAPSWSYVHSELRRKNVTLALLWAEYKEVHGQAGYEYSRFCELYRTFQGQLNLSMRQTHVYGDKCFVDFAGQWIPIVDLKTGELLLKAQIFVAVLGGSSYTYVEAVASQDLACWIKAHEGMMKFFGGCTRIVIPDNLLSAVHKAHLYEPEINPTYQEWAEHYNVAIVPARVRRPKDKAKAEVGVQIVQRWILAALRNRVFYSLEELNESIDGLLDVLNKRPFKKLPGSREELFLTKESRELRPLPREPYSFGTWSRELKVGFDYHIKVAERLYSVPSRLAGKRVDARVSVSIVEMFHKGQRIASHRLCAGAGPPVTQAEHMPSHHRAYAEWTPERVLDWAAEAGESVKQFCLELMNRRTVPEQAFRPCMGVISLAKKYGVASLNAACRKAIRIRSFSYRGLNSILVNNLQDRPENAAPTHATPDSFHENVRGASYFISKN